MNLRTSAEVAARMKQIREMPKNALKTTFVRIGLEGSGRAQQLAPILSGDLRRTIYSSPTQSSVRFGAQKVYARIHDLGGVIVPKKKKVLAWHKGGKWHFAKKVTIPKFNGRGYLTPAFVEMKNGRAVAILSEEISSFLKK